MIDGESARIHVVISLKTTTCRDDLISFPAIPIPACIVVPLVIITWSYIDNVSNDWVATCFGCNI